MHHNYRYGSLREIYGTFSRLLSIPITLIPDLIGDKISGSRKIQENDTSTKNL